MAQDTAILSVPHDLAADQFELILRRLADDLTWGADLSRFVGPGIDYSQSRPFVYGDSVRHIDWRVTARAGRVHVKEYEATKRIGLFLLVDTSASMAVSSRALSKHDAAVWIAGVLSLVALRRRSPIAILSCGERAGRTTPTLSRGQVWRWIEDLRRPGFHECTTLAERISQVEALSFHTAAVIVISDLHDPVAVPAIRRLAQRHDTLVLQLADPAERGRLHAGFLRAQEAETGNAFIAGPRTRWPADPGADLAGSGVDRFVIRTDEELIPALRRALDVHSGGLRKAR